jgi:hypothetical protein
MANIRQRRRFVDNRNRGELQPRRCSAAALQRSALPLREAMMAEMNGDSADRIMQEDSSRVAEAADSETKNANAPGDGSWLEDIANAVRDLSPSAAKASVEKKQETLAQALQTNQDYLAVAAQESGRKNSFRRQFQKLGSVIDRSNSALITSKKAGCCRLFSVVDPATSPVPIWRACPDRRRSPWWRGVPCPP